MGISTADTVPLHALTATLEETKVRRNEAAGSVSTAAGLPAGNWEREKRRSKPHGIECGLDLRFSRFQTREARGGGHRSLVSVWRGGASRLLVYLPSSILRIFASSTMIVVRLSVTVKYVDHELSYRMGT